MDDDLDELLDEVEKKFCHNISVSLASSIKEGKCGKDSGERRNVGYSKLMLLKLMSRNCIFLTSY